MRRKSINKGVIAVAFSVGLLLSCFCSARILIAILAITVILLGCSYARCR
ncbi:MAG: hypothetical protein U0L72_01815 [Acutalibacteraceae bacterium]|nr:hypothetical protein [Acutalibacteraceae bacterium]